MSTTYAKSQTTAQKKDAPSASSVLDASSQSESLQRKADMANNAAQRAEAPRPNNTGMPDNLKAGIESLSGFSMDNVRVHYNSSKPATVQALAYTQGTDIHVAPGQEKCLPHEAWHVAQQMAGRVSPTTNINGMPVNDNAALEHEADVMGEKAVQCKKNDDSNGSLKNEKKSDKVVQCEKVEPAGDDDIVSVGSEVADKPEHPHIAFETLAGGSRISELEGLYNNVIKAYEGKASVYMGVNVCKTNYKKIGNDIWTYGDKTPNDIVDELNPLKNEVKTTLQSPNAKDYHKITLIPFSWSLVGLKSAGVDIRLTQNQFGELKKGINPLLQSSVPSKGKKSTSDKGGPLVTVKKYENVENYNFPFYEARAYVMGKTVGNEADFYRWIDSDVRDDSSIEQINLMGYGAFGEKKDFLLAYLRNACCYIASTKSKKEYGEIVQEQNVIVLLNYLETKDRQSYGCFIRMCEKCEKESEKESGNLVYSGFYDWKQIDPVSKNTTLITTVNWGKFPSDQEKKNAVLGIFLSVLNKYEALLRTYFWNNRTAFSEDGYKPEPIVYMNDGAHTTALSNLASEASESEDPEKEQASESNVAFNSDGLTHRFIDSFSVSKPIKDYFQDLLKKDGMIDKIVTYITAKKRKSSAKDLFEGGADGSFYKDEFSVAVRNSRQSAFGKWVNWDGDVGAIKAEEYLQMAYLEFKKKILELVAPPNLTPSP